jgi:hypothetical protein
MDRNHQLDAPSNDSLQTIEQVGDRSELGSLYPHAHDAWEGEDLMSREAREEKRDLEQLRLSLGIRKWFAVIGLLIPLPILLGSILTAIASTYLDVTNLAVLILPVLGIVLVWLYVSYRSMKQVQNIFYQHSVRATPFVVTLLAFLVFSLQALYVTMLSFYNDSLVQNTVATSIVMLLISIAYSGILIFIWTAKKISGAFKIGLIGIFAGIITLVTLLVNLL